MPTLYGRIAATSAGRRHLAVARLRREVLRSVHAALRASGISEAELAERLGVSQRRVRRLLPGDGNIRVSVLAEVLHELGFELDVRLVAAGEPRRAVVEQREVMPAAISTMTGTR